MLMAVLNDSPVTTGRRRGVRRAKKHSLKVDMTPMVDLGFLLIAFFVITTELSRPASLDLVMPKDGPPTGVPMSAALTFLLGKDDNVYYYHGEFTEAQSQEIIMKTTFQLKNSLGNVIREKQKQLDMMNATGKTRDDLMLIIKPGKDANYKNVIDALDEALIYNVKKYVVVKADENETEYMRTK